MVAEVRRKQVREILRKQQHVSMRHLEELLDASPATIRRDLAAMESRGEVVRVHGGALHPQYLQPEPSFDRRSRLEIKAKRQIAEEAIRHVPESASVFIDAGTTCLEIGRRLLSRRDLTLVTYSVPLLTCAHGSEACLICLGGELRAVSKALVGSLAQDWLRRLRMDVAFLGASGLCKEEGASATVLSETAIKSEAIRRSRTAILVADSQKWNRPETLHFAKWSRFAMWITDHRVPKSAVKRVRSYGVNVVVTRSTQKERKKSTA